MLALELNATNSTCGDSSSSGSSSSGTFIVGIFIAVLGSTFEQLGLTLWKLADNRVQKRRAQRANQLEDESHAEKCRSPESNADSTLAHFDDESEITTASTREGKTSALNFDEVSVKTLPVATSNEGANDADAINQVDSVHQLSPNIVEIPADELTIENHKSGILLRLRNWMVEKEALISVAAFLVFAGGNGLNFIALGLIQESIVTLIGAWALVINIITAKLLLGEELERLDGVAVGFIVFGIALSIFGSHHSATKWCIARLVVQYKQLSVILMIIFNLSLIIFLISMQTAFFFWKRYQESKGNYVKMRQTIKFSYMLVGAQISWFTVLFGKSFSSLIVLTFNGDNQFNDPFVFIIVIAFLISLPSQLFYVAASLAVNDALFHVPNFFIFYNLGSFVGGGLLYEEMKEFETSNYVMFVLGVVVLFSGVLLVNKSEQNKKKRRKKIIKDNLQAAGALDTIAEGEEEGVAADGSFHEVKATPPSPHVSPALVPWPTDGVFSGITPPTHPRGVSPPRGRLSVILAPRPPPRRRRGESPHRMSGADIWHNSRRERAMDRWYLGLPQADMEVGLPGLSEMGAGEAPAPGEPGHRRTLSDSAVELMSLYASAHVSQSFVTASQAPTIQLLEADGSILRGMSSGAATPSGASTRWMSPLMARFLLETAALQQAGRPGGNGGEGGGEDASMRVIVEVDQALFADGALRMPHRLCVA